MKKIIIDGKEYYQQDESDIDKLPSMLTHKHILSERYKNLTLEELEKLYDSEFFKTKDV